MLSSVLRSPRAVQVNIAIIRTFARLREVLATHADLAKTVEQHDRKIDALFRTVGDLLRTEDEPRHPIGHIHSGE